MNNQTVRICSTSLGHYALLLTAGTVFFLTNLGGPTLWDLDEGRNAGASWAMAESGNLVVPTFNGKLRADKPALLYWLQVAAYRVFGYSEFAARLPSALAALLTVLLCYEIGRRLFDAATALLAGFITASTPMVCAAARFANPDALLNLFNVMALFLLWLGYVRGRLPFISIALACGMGVLAKGPVGLAMPGAIALLFLFWERRPKLAFDRRVLLGVLTFCLTALPWYVWVTVETKGDFLKEFLLTHNVERFRNAMENHHGWILYYPTVILVGFAPWSVFLVLACWYGGKSVTREKQQPAQIELTTARDRGHESSYRFLFCWVTVYLVFFSFAATKLPNYVLPIYLPLALLTARFLNRWRYGEIQPARWLLLVCFLTFALIGLVASFGLLLAGGVIRMGFMRDRYVPGIELWAALGLVLIVGGGFAWRCARQNQRHRSVISITITAILFVAPMAAWASIGLNRHKAPRPLVEQAGICRRDEDIRIAALDLEHLPSLNFYCQRDILHIQEDRDAVSFLRLPQPAFLVVSESRWNKLKKVLPASYTVRARHYDMFHACFVVVVDNR
jgi:4-amino-4-deoxy-L-arabinose transferase-like glycosyltransferase